MSKPEQQASSSSSFLSTLAKNVETQSGKDWSSVQHALAYLNVADHLHIAQKVRPYFLEHIPNEAKRILDLGIGDGRLIKLLKIGRPDLETVALDVFPTMLNAALESFC